MHEAVRARPTAGDRIGADESVPAAYARALISRKMSKLLDKGLKAKRESKYVDFKRSFDPHSAGEWCELVKDMVAMANSGGGVVLIGLDNYGAPSKENVQPVLDIDHAKLVDKIRKYTGLQFSDLEIHEVKKQGETIAVIEISAVKVPMVFQDVGTYEVSPGKQ